MKIGIIGSSERAVALARLLTSGGHEVTIGDPMSEQAAEVASQDLKIKLESPYDQAMCRDLVFFTSPRAQGYDALSAMGSEPHAVVVDARDGGPAVAHEGAELLARHLNSHRVVRALIASTESGANVPLCGDDPVAKKMVQEAFEAAGCIVTDRGPLSNAPELEPPENVAAA